MAAMNRARRVIASETPAIVRLTCSGRQRTRLDVRRRRAYVEHDPVNVRSDGRVRVINDKRQRLRPRWRA